MSAAGWANHLWAAANRPHWRRFRAALGDPGASQRRLLLATVRANAATAYGRRHGFDRIATVEEYRRRVPLVRWDELAPWIERIQRGEPRVLTRERVLRLTPSGGSTAAAKLVPLTRTLLAEFQRAIGPWVVDVFERHPGLARGRAYWSVSPAAVSPAAEPADLGEPNESGSETRGGPTPGSGSTSGGGTGGAVPIGFAEDTVYLGSFFQRLVDRTLAVPGAVARLAEVESFRYATLLHLLAARDLTLVSVWHPSFLTLLLEPLGRWWEPLLDDLAAGTLTLPGSRSAGATAVPVPAPGADPARAAELRRLGASALAGEIWPRLAAISAWADGHAAGAAIELAERFPGVAIEPKGLVATEAFVSLPFAGARPLAVRSHFFELIDDSGRSHLADEVAAGGEYGVAVTTGGGLYRYRLGDRVRVVGFLGATPCLHFVGREDRVSDRRGEKLSDGHVAAVLERLLGGGGGFAMLAPDDEGGRPGYTLYLDSRRPSPPGLAENLERGLAENPHYRWCVRLGQLAPARVFRVVGDPHHLYIEHCRRAGQRLGDIKPNALSAESGWSRSFPGRYLAAAAGEPANGGPIEPPNERPTQGLKERSRPDGAALHAEHP